MKQKVVGVALAAGLVLGSAGLMKLLGRWEGESEFTVYADKLANGLPTVCKGLTKHVTKTPIVVGEYWGPEKCEREERAAVIDVQLALLECFQIAPPQQVFDAATSHAWNNGVPATCGSAAIKAWNLGDWSLGCRRLQLSDEGKPVWSYVRDGKGGYRFVKGLANRRAAERSYCEQFVTP